jgi:hypothetical protein
VAGGVSAGLWRGGVAVIAAASLCAGVSGIAAAAASTTTTTTSSTTNAGGLPSAFAWFAPGLAPPASFHLYKAVSNTVQVADPPKLKPLGGSHGALSFAARGARGAYFAFLNVTPQQGTESLTGWSAYRVGVLRSGGAQQIRVEAEDENLPFNGGTGACVIDDYVTRVGRSAFHEIACFVEGPHSGSVLVVAAPPASWRSYAGPFERVIDSYRVL